MNYFLVKTEPSTFSLEDFRKEKITTWEGVRNYQAINTIKTWQIGDIILIYHSVSEARIVGLGKVISTPKKDPNDKISWIADLEFILEFDKKITLKEIKNYSQKTNLFTDFTLIRQSRLSVCSCPSDFIAWFFANVKP
jgi:predicted RNA-binding protein with PUA-like domain